MNLCMLRAARILTIVAAIAICGGLSAYTVADAPLQIAMIAPLTIDPCGYRSLAIDAAELAVEDINSNGGLLGSELELVYIDENSPPANTLRKLQKLLQRGKLIAVLGVETVDLATEVATLCRESGVPFLTPLQNLPTTSNDVNLIPLAPDISIEAAQLAQLAVDLGYRSAYVVFPNDADGRHFADCFQASFISNGGTILAPITYNVETDDFSPAISEGVLEKPGLVVPFAAPSSGYRLIKQILEYKLGTAYLLPSRLSHGCILDLIYSSGLDQPSSTTMGVFTPSVSGLWAYDATVLVALAAEAVSSVDLNRIRSTLDNQLAGSGPPVHLGNYIEAREAVTSGTSATLVGLAGFSNSDGSWGASSPVVSWVLNQEILRAVQVHYQQRGSTLSAVYACLGNLPPPGPDPAEDTDEESAEESFLACMTAEMTGAALVAVASCAACYFAVASVAAGAWVALPPGADIIAARAILAHGSRVCTIRICGPSLPGAVVDVTQAVITCVREKIK